MERAGRTATLGKPGGVGTSWHERVSRQGAIKDHLRPNGPSVSGGVTVVLYDGEHVGNVEHHRQWHDVSDRLPPPFKTSGTGVIQERLTKKVTAHKFVGIFANLGCQRTREQPQCNQATGDAKTTLEDNQNCDRRKFHLQRCLFEAPIEIL